MAKEILCAYGVDVDAVGGWLGSYGGEDSPCDISRGMFAGEVGSLRLLRLFERFGIRTTWLIPAHSIETFPEQMQAVEGAEPRYALLRRSPEPARAALAHSACWPPRPPHWRGTGQREEQCDGDLRLGVVDWLAMRRLSWSPNTPFDQPRRQCRLVVPDEPIDVPRIPGREDQLEVERQDVNHRSKSHTLDTG
jgi:hypothetical protein